MDGAQRVTVTGASPIVDPNPARLEAWFHRSRLWLWIPGLVAAAVALGVTAANLMPAACHAVSPPRACRTIDHAQTGLYLGVTFLSIAAGVAFALWMSRLLGSLLSRRRPEAIERRLQMAKEWFLRGDLDDGEFLALEAALKAHADPSSPGRRRATAAWAFLLVGVPLTIAASIFLLIFVAELRLIEASVQFVMGIFIALHALAGVYLTTSGARLRSQAKILRRRALEDLDRAEHEVLQRSRARRLGTPIPAVKAPSFRPWG
jgi:uncharacterized membrane protein